MSEQIIWTVLPQRVINRNDEKVLWLTVLVSPRLKGNQDGTLSSFPHFINWPLTLTKTYSNFSLNFNGKFMSSPTSLQVDSSLWQNLFKNELYIKSHQYKDYTSRNFLSYSHSTLTDFVKQQYLSIATSTPTEHPNPSQLSTVLKDFTHNEQDHKTMMLLLSTHQAPSIKHLQEIPNITPTAASIIQHKIYHTQNQTIQQPLPKQSDFEKLLDFHQIISSLANYPEIMRKLGLLFDLYVPAANVPLSNASQQLWVQLSCPSFKNDLDFACQTVYFYDGAKFQALSNPAINEISDGMLPLNDASKYSVVQIDTDGATKKLANLNIAIQTAQNTKSQDTPTDFGVPSLRSAGFSVTKQDRASLLLASFNRAKTLNNAFTGYMTTQQLNQPTQTPSLSSQNLLYAEDLHRGYRIDILDTSTMKWQSLNFRSGTYTYLDSNNVEQQIESGVIDEGWVQIGVTQSSDPNIPEDQNNMKLHESLFTWKGWSLSVTRPGITIDSQDKANEIQPVLATMLKLKTNFLPVNGTLPRLRFGRRYRIRARSVDLGGGGLTLDEADDSKATAETSYFRFEPVQAPFFVLMNDLDACNDAAESLARLVIRSFNDDPSKDNVATIETSERHVAPPRTSQLMAEEHGMFDDPQTGKMMFDAATYEMIKAKDAPKDFVSKTAMNNNPIDTSDQMVLPYLPDPMSAGASIQNLPGLPNGAFKINVPLGIAEPAIASVAPVNSGMLIDFGDLLKWPNLLPFRLRLKEGTSAPVWDANSRILDVFLPKATVVKLRISSFTASKDLVKNGLLNWVSEVPTQSNPAGTDSTQINSIVAQGRHWMTHPFKEVYLVHAVQQPLGKPEFETLTQIRNIGWTYVKLVGKVKLHGQSTIKMELIGRWTERLDNPNDLTNDPVNDRTHGSSHAFDMSVAVTDNEANFSPPSITTGLFLVDSYKKHVFGDTKYRHVFYKARATSRFTEYLPSSILVPNLACPPSSANLLTDASRSLQMSTSVNLQNDSQYLPPVFRESEEFELDIPNAAKPAAPSVLYVIPTFGWASENGSSTRKGHGVRIYINRPWFSSGDNEKLGVILWSGQIPSDVDNLEKAKQAVTMIGSDPIWNSEATPQNLTIRDFPNAINKEMPLRVFQSQVTSQLIISKPELSFETPQNITSSVSPKAITKEMAPQVLPSQIISNIMTIKPDSSLTQPSQLFPLDELFGQAVEVAAHEVAFDPVRNLWYSDIVVDFGGSYFPFVRFALARFQPISVSGAHLSKVVLTDFVQLAPDRTLTIVRLQNAVKVSVSGVSYSSGPCKSLVSAACAALIEVSLERYDSSIGTNLGWVPESNAIVTNDPAISSPVFFSGTVTFPSPVFFSRAVTLPSLTSTQPQQQEQQPTTPTKYRLVVKEYEQLPITPPLHSGGFSPVTTNNQKRLVYADQIEL